MTEPASALSSWGTFYAIVGSSGGALIGLQFVVIALIADRRSLVSAGSLSAFGTPTVVHFAGALIVSAVTSAPWPSLASLSVALEILGLGGLVYAAIVLRRALRQTSYEPVWQDWLWHTVLPSVSYAALAVMAAWLPRSPQPALFVIGAAALGLLLIGIRNAWDTVTYIVIFSAEEEAKKTADDGVTKTD
jgi:hypothetical protein